MSDSWEERQRLEAEAKRLEALSKVTPEQFAAAKLEATPHKHIVERMVGWATLWLLILCSWSFLMMTFKKDVWPR